MPAQQAVAHLAGLQAQALLAPYVGLWTRLAGFRHQDLKDLMTERSVVRAHLMRNAVHLVTATDFLTFRPLFQPVMERALAGHFGARLAGVDLAELRDLAAALLAGTALTRTELARRLSARWPGHDPGSPLPAGHGANTGTLLVDGMWQADWTIARSRNLAELEIRPFIPLPAPVRDAIAAEGSRLLEFAAPAAAHDVRFAARA
jgi:Winged helix DNA-binding domain